MEEARPGLLLVWLRAFLLGTAALLSGTVAHASADGLLPSLIAMLVLLGLSTSAAAWFLRRRAGGLRLVVLVLTGQTVVHLALTLLAGHRGDPTGSPMSMVAPAPGGAPTLQDELMGGALPRASATTPAFGWVTHLARHLSEQAPAMVAAHLLAAVALGLWLTLGEALLWSVLLVTAAWLVGLVAVVEAGSPAPLRVSAPSLRAARSDLVVVRLPQLASRAVSHRGPPVRSAA